MNVNDIITPLKVAGQAPLDRKLVVNTLVELTDLGVGNTKPFSYYRGMIVFCNQTKKYYQWFDVFNGEQKLLVNDFVYPNGSVYEGIDYSGLAFNFIEFTFQGEPGINGNGIHSIILQATNGLVKTYRINFDDSSYFDFNVTDGQNGTGTTTVLVNGITTKVSGVGTALDPYKVELENPQKIINTFPYTLLPTDDKHTLFINNLSVDVNIFVPNNLPANFSCYGFQLGTGEVTINGTAVNILKPSNLQNIVKGENYWFFLEKKLTTNDFLLGGSLKLV